MILKSAYYYGFTIFFWNIFMIRVQSEAAKHYICESNEVYVDCFNCGPTTCADLGDPNTCRGTSAKCKPQCVCVDGYVRDAKRNCIPKYMCPSCGGDRNATSGCGNHCGNRCSDYDNVNKTCWTGCRYNSCDCRTGYVYHDSLGVCVHPSDCSGTVIHITDVWTIITALILLSISI